VQRQFSSSTAKKMGQDQSTSNKSKQQTTNEDLRWDPNRVWEERKDSIIVNSVTPTDPTVDKPENSTRFVCISDTHSLHNYIKTMPKGDVLIHAGDFSNIGLPEDIDSLNTFLGSLPYQHKIVIAGNHDLTFHPESYEQTWMRFGHPEKYDCQLVKAKLTNCTYLEDEAVEVLGFKIYGSPWQPWFYDWAFNLPRGPACQEKWSLIPNDIDILVTHGPPLGHGDLCKHGGRAGCVNLLDEIERRIKPKYHVFGHIHEGYGITTNGQTIFVNASTCNSRYDRNNLNPPIVFDLPNKQ